MAAGASLENPLSVREVSRFFGARTVLRNASVEVPEGSILCLFGRSGSGKSTLLNIIAGLLRPDHGAVYMLGRPVTHLPPQSRDIGFIFQDSSALFPHLSVEENIKFAVTVGKRSPRGGDLDRALGDILERTSLSSYRRRRIGSLSGGERQRVAIARTLVANPKVVLLDEPLSSLDNSLRREMLDLIRELHADLGGAYLYVTHDEREASYLATDLAIIDAESIMQTGPPIGVFERPRTSGVAQLLADWAVIPIDSRAAKGWASAPLEALKIGEITDRAIELGEVEIGYRISRAKLESRGGGCLAGSSQVPGQVERIWPWYGQWRLLVRVEAGRLEVHSDDPWPCNAEVVVSVPQSEWRVWVKGKSTERE